MPAQAIAQLIVLITECEVLIEDAMPNQEITLA